MHTKPMGDSEGMFMFEVKCYKEHKTLYLSTTHNGYQWTAIAIKNIECEIPLIVKALKEQLEYCTCPKHGCKLSPISICEQCMEVVPRQKEDNEQCP